MDDTIVDELAGWPIRQVAEEIAKRYNASFESAVFEQQKTSIYSEQYIADILPISFVVEHLKASAGKVKIAVVSGGSRSIISKTLNIIGVDRYVDALVCAGETERGKPFPGPFLKAAELLDVRSEECLVFEDGDPGVKAAESAAMKWIWIDKI